MSFFSCLACNLLDAGRCRFDHVDCFSLGDLEKRPGQGVVDTVLIEKSQYYFCVCRGFNRFATMAREEVRDCRSNHGSLAP